jgi:exosortase D (VPLPA-CTERM-specific)
MKSETYSFSNFQLVSLIILALGTVIIYWPVLVNLLTQLAADEDFSYGLILPFVSAYLVYLKWPELRGTPWRPSWVGLAFMALGSFLCLGGKLAAESYSSRVSFTIFVMGILLLTGGWRILRLLIFPLLLLILMLPLPGILMGSLTLPLQLISSRLAAIFLRALDYPLVLQGNVIDLGIRQLQVVAACSGLRYILSLLALGIIYCYFYQRRFWKGAVLLISLVPGAIIANALRIAAMGIYPALQEGFLHNFTGWLIFVFCFGSLTLLNWLLNSLEPQTHVLAAQYSPTSIAAPVAPSCCAPFLIAGLAMIVLSGSLIYTVGSPPRTALIQSFEHFPLQVGPWQGRRTYMDPQIFEKTDANSYFDADYATPGHEPVSLYITYYEQQNSAGGLGHNPANCMTGSGWQTLETGTTEIVPGLPVNYLLLKRSGVSTPLLVYYWNIEQGHWMALGGNARLYKLITIYHSLRLKRSDWALVRLITPVTKDVATAGQGMKSFGKLLIPILPKFIHSESFTK